jgi:putative ABC transport system permease protein
MSAVVAVARAQLRQRWPALVAIGLIAGLAGAAVLGALAGAHRTATAYDRLVSATDFPDAVVMLIEPPPGFEGAIRALPEVERSVSGVFVVGINEAATSLVLMAVQASPTPIADLPVVRGRAADPSAPGELVLSERSASESGVDVGDVIPFRALSPEEFQSLLTDEGALQATGPFQELKVVGVVRVPTDVVLDDFPVFLATPAFLAAHGAELGTSRQLWVHRAAGVGPDEFAAAVTAAAPSAEIAQAAPVFDLELERSTIDDATRVLIVGLLGFGLVALLTGAVVVGQAVARHVQTDAQDHRRLHELGLDRRRRVLAVAAPGALTAVVAVVTAVAGAHASSTWTPIGAARSAEPRPGLLADWPVLIGGGLLLLVAVVLAWVAAGSRLASGVAAGRRRPVRRPGVAGRLAGWGAGATVTAGVSMAFDPSGTRGRAGRVAMVGSMVGIIGLLAVGVFGANLHRLGSDPKTWGFPADHLVNVPEPVRQPTYDSLDRAPEVVGFAEVQAGSVQLDGRLVAGYVLQPMKGSVEPILLSGRSPASPGEVALGPQLLEDLEVAVGGTVELTVDGERRSATVVGSSLTLGMTEADNRTNAVLLPPGTSWAPEFHAALVQFDPEVDPEVAAAGIYGDLEYGAAVPPASVVHVTALDRLPHLLALFLGSIGVAAIVHTVLSAGRRRRRDLAVLRSIGMTPTQSGTTMATVALSGVVVALVVGVPLGLAAGNLAWRSVAVSLDVVPGTWMPGWLLAVVPGALLVALLAAAFPIRRVIAAAPAEILRAE